LLLAATATVLGGCTTPVAGDLTERDANEVVVALEDSGVAATKVPDPTHEGRWRVDVPRHEGAAAVTALQTHGLPHPNAPGVLDTLDEGALIPSRASEHARLIAGTSGELERSLLGIDGVLSARVHLAVTPRDSLALDAHPLVPTASVLLRHRGATPPVGVADVQRLVAGAVPGLNPERVSVVTSPVPDAHAASRNGLTRFGPVSVARGSVGPLRWLVAIATGTYLLLLGTIGAIWLRLRRARRALEAAPSAPTPEADG
jgi:type III secretion protein J